MSDIKEKHCKVCYVGTPYNMLKYDSSGTCLDYIYEKLKVPFSFAWEVYSNEKFFPEMDNYINNNKKLEYSRILETDIIKSFNNLRIKNTSIIKADMNKITYKKPQLVDWSYNIETNNNCYLLFNPKEKEGFDFLINNWSQALVTLINNIYDKRNLLQNNN